MGIKSVYPFNRTSQLIVMDDGTRMMRINTMQNPLYYRNPSDLLLPVNAASKTITSSAAGNICLRSASVASVGFKVSDDAYKYLGLRPDCVQDGSEQLEFSIVTIEFDGKSQAIDLSSNTAKSDYLTEIGPLVYVQSLRQRTRQLIRVENPISSFKIVYQIDITGLKLVRQADEFWFYSERTGDFRFKIRKPYLVDINGEPNNTINAVKHTLVENKDGTLTYTKENTIDLSGVKAPYFIDADTVYSTTADGYVSITEARNSAALAWAAVHDAVTGASVVTNASSSACGLDYTHVDPVYTFILYRSFFYFSIPSLTGTLLTASVNLYGASYAESTICVQQGTQADTLGVADFDSFSGSSWGNSGAWSTSGYNTINLNATGVAATSAASGSTLKVCAREYGHDYPNTVPYTDYRAGCCYADNSGTSADPYMLLVTGPGGVKSLNGLSVALIKTVNGLAYSSVKTFSGI